MTFQTALTIIGTVISGVIVFLLSQIIVQRYVKPYEEYKWLKREVTYILVMYANLYCNPIKVTDSNQETSINERRQARIETRKIASKVCAFQERIGYRCPGIPPRKRFLETASELIRLSNSFFLTPAQNVVDVSTWNRECAERIKLALSIKANVKEL